MVGGDEPYQNVTLTTLLQANVDSIAFRFVRLALAGFRNDYMRGKGKMNPSCLAFSLQQGEHIKE